MRIVKKQNISKNKLIDDIPVAAKWAQGNLNATGYKVDGSVDSLKEIDRFFDEQQPNGVLSRKKIGNILFSLGCYLGEVLIKNYGGVWLTDDNDPKNEINIAVKLKDGTIIWPVIQIIKRDREGNENAIYPYALSVVNDPRIQKLM